LGFGREQRLGWARIRRHGGWIAGGWFAGGWFAGGWLLGDGSGIGDDPGLKDT
jgi:hypothetical protein